MDKLLYNLAILLAGFGWFGLVVMLGASDVSSEWKWIVASLLIGSALLFSYDRQSIDELNHELEKRKLLEKYKKQRRE